MKISFSNKFDSKDNLVIIYSDKNQLLKKIVSESWKKLNWEGWKIK